MAEVKFAVDYKCECCGIEFVSHRTRTGEKLCADCIGLRRALKGFLRNGLDEATLLKRGRKLLGVNGKKHKAELEEVLSEPIAEVAEAES